MPMDSTRTFCRSCGYRKRLTWPKDDPRYCSMTCAAYSFDSYSEVGGDWEAAHCTNCGESHHDHNPDGACDQEVDWYGE